MLTGFRLAVDGKYKKSMPLCGVGLEASMFLPRTMGLPQDEAGLGGNSWVFFMTIAAWGRLRVYLSSSLRRSTKSQGLEGLSIRPAAKSSH